MPPAPANILNNRSAYIPPMASKDEKAQPTSREDSAYYNGSSQAVIPTKLTVSRLETVRRLEAISAEPCRFGAHSPFCLLTAAVCCELQRRKLTKTSDKLVIVLVGLPARGKSFISRKLLHYVNWTGVKCQAFNVGKYRRKAYAEVQATASLEPATDSPSGACDANFFSAGNTEASALRQQVAQLALDDMLAWLDDDEGDDGVVEDLPLTIDASRHSLANMSVTSMTRSIKPHSTYQKVAIFDATNSTEARRRWVLEECTSPEKRGAKKTGVVFVESICTDQELLVENYRFKVSSSPDYKNMSIEEGLEDLLVRVRNYEAQYETIQDDNMSYIKIFDLSTKLMVNHIYGRMAKDLVPALMAWHIGSRPVYLIRPGRTNSGVDLSTHASLEMQPGPGKLNGQRRVDSNLSLTSLRKSLRNDGLSQGGRGFREALWEYLHDEVKAFISKRRSVQDNKHTGTSMSGLEASPFLDDAVDKGKAFEEIVNSMSGLLPLRILASTMPRALETVSFEEFDIPVSQMSNLNPIDKGDFAGLEMDGVKNEDPSLYSQLQSDPFHTRYVFCVLRSGMPRVFECIISR